MIVSAIKRAIGKVLQTKEHKKTAGKERSPLWPKYRKAWLEKNPSCAACGSTEDLQVHHCLPFHMQFTGEQVRAAGVTLGRDFLDSELISGHELELNTGNFISLCEPSGPEGHHLSIGHIGNFKKFNPNVREDAANLLKSLAR